MNRARNIRVFVAMLIFCTATSIPMSFFFFLLPAILRKAGYSPEIVSLVALVYLPYALRVLWAPLVDHISKGKQSRYQNIAFVSLFLGVVSIAGFFAFRPETDVTAIIVVAIVIFIFLATGMTALDGYIIKILSREERKTVSAYQAAGFTMGGILVGLGAIAVDGMGWNIIIIAMMAATAFLVVLFYFLLKPLIKLKSFSTTNQIEAAQSLSLWQFLKVGAIQRRIAISILANGGLGLTVGYLPIFQVDRGLTLGQVGMFGAIGSNLCGLFSALVAGGLLIRFGAWRTLAGICTAAVLFFASAALLHDDFPGQIFAIVISLTAMTLSYAYIVPYRALVLMISNGKHGATQAAFMSSFDVVVTIIAASLAGLAVTSFGLTGLFSISLIASFCGVLLALWAQTHANTIQTLPIKGIK